MHSTNYADPSMTASAYSLSKTVTFSQTPIIFVPKKWHKAITATKHTTEDIPLNPNQCQYV
jgi:hypothetical protein